MIRSRKLGRRVGGGLNWRFYDRVFVFAEGIKVVPAPSGNLALPSLRRPRESDAAKIIKNAPRLGSSPQVLRESVFSMSLACVTVGFVLLLLLGDVIASLLVGTMVVCVCLITYGSIYWRGGGATLMGCASIFGCAALACFALGRSEVAALSRRLRGAPPKDLLLPGGNSRERTRPHLGTTTT